MTEKQIKVGDIEITVIKKKIKHMYLRVLAPDGRVRITAPLRISDEKICAFARSRIRWIEMQQKRILLQTQRRKTPEHYETGETVWLWGRPYLLEVKSTETAGVPSVELHQGSSNRVLSAEGNDINDMTAVFSQRAILYAAAGSTVEQRGRLLKEWYRRRLKSAIPAIFEECERIVGVRANEWRVRDMKTRWGTCNPAKKRIWLNLKLIEMPPECLKYVVIHELVHLLEPSHNQRFYYFMNRFMPEWKEIRRQMREW